MSSSLLQSVAQKYFDAVHSSDLDALAGVFTQDAALRFPTLDPVVGRENIRAFYANVFAFYTKRHDEVTCWMSNGKDSVAAEIHFDGTTNTGQTAVFDAVDIFTIEDGSISELRIYYDSFRVMKMLGTLPSN